MYRIIILLPLSLFCSYFCFPGFVLCYVRQPLSAVDSQEKRLGQRLTKYLR